MKNAVDYMCEVLYNNEEGSGVLTDSEERRKSAESDSVMQNNIEIESLKNRIAELETKLSGLDTDSQNIDEPNPDAN